MAGDRSPEVVEQVNRRKASKVQALFRAEDEELFEISRITLSLPEEAQIFPTRTCQQCGEKMMEPKAMRTANGKLLCIPCYEQGDKPG
jgi:formylmethanofuran dehydrogenase subunit E